LLTDEGIWNTGETRFDYEDDRFVWQQMSREGITVHWSASGGDPTTSGPFYGQTILDVAAESLRAISEILPLKGVAPFDVYVYPSAADLRSGLRLAGLFDDERLATPNTILVTAVNQQSAATDLRQAIPYELTHLMLSRVTGTSYSQLPWWLSEGLATRMELVANPRQDELLAQAVSVRTVLSFDALCRKPELDDEQLLLARGQSASFVDYILREHGRRQLIELIAAYARGADCQTGVQQVLRDNLDDLARDWLNSVLPAPLAIQFAQRYAFWFLIALGSLGGAGLLAWYVSQR
jgi:hypothetical protein